MRSHDERKKIKDVIPTVAIVDPIDTPKKHVWRFVRENIMRRNSLNLVSSNIITYNDCVGHRNLYTFKFPVIVPDWLLVGFFDVSVKKTYARGRDGYRYAIYEKDLP